MTSKYVASPTSRRSNNNNNNNNLNNNGKEKEQLEDDKNHDDKEEQKEDSSTKNHEKQTIDIDTLSTTNQTSITRSASSLSDKINETMKDCPTKSQEAIKQFIKYELGDLQETHPKVKLDDALTEDGKEIYFETELDIVKPLNVSKTIISPYSPWKNQWDFIIIILVLYNAIFIPVAIAFPDFEGESGWVGYFIDSLFIIDIFLSFRTAYIQENGIVNWNAKEIRKNYLKLWFTIDLIASIPLELFVLMISILNNGVDSSQLQLKLLLRMLKLPRLFRMGRIFKYLERFKYASTMRIIRLLVGYVLAGHWVACGFLFVCRLQDPYETVTFLHEIHDKSILAQYLITLRTAFFFFSGENVEVQTVGEEICKYFKYIHTS